MLGLQTTTTAFETPAEIRGGSDGGTGCPRIAGIDSHEPLDVRSRRLAFVLAR